MCTWIEAKPKTLVSRSAWRTSVCFQDGVALFVYLDDLIIVPKTVDLLKQFKANLAVEFQVKDPGRPKFILGVQIIETSEGIFLSQ